MIQVILLERIERLGTMGQVVRVRPGFARNFLLPQKKALRATKENMAVFEKQRAELEARNAALRVEAEKTAKKIESLKLIVIRQASEMGQLFGSVTSRDVADVAKEGKHPIERAMVQIDTPIKTLGLFPVRVKLHPEVAVNIIVNVARSAEEALVQADKAAAAARKAEAPAQEAVAEAAPAAEGEATEATAKTKKPRAKKSEEA